MHERGAEADTVPVMRTVVESPRGAERNARAAGWLAKRSEPHVTVLAASIDAAADVARAAMAQSERKASLGWNRSTLNAFATVLTRSELAKRGLAPASQLALEAICARIVHDEPDLGRLTPIRDRPGLPRALARTLGELRMARVTKVADRDLAKLLAAYEEAIDVAKLADRARALTIATEVAAGRSDIGALLLLDVPVRTPVERDFLAALAKQATEVLALVPSGDARTIDLTVQALGKPVREQEEADEEQGPLSSLQTGLFGTTTTAATKITAPEAVTVLSAPGESRECVEIARIVLAEAEKGTPFDRMAVLLRTPAYGNHVTEAFRRAKVPAFFARGTKRPDPSGRAFLALLACAAEHLSARRFSEYLSLGQVPDEGTDGAPPAALPRAERAATPDDETLDALIGPTAMAEGEEDDEEEKPKASEEGDRVTAGTLRTPRHWERLLVEASVIGHADRWRSRLEGLAAKLQNDFEAYEKKDEAALAESSKRELVALDALRRFALPLIDDLAALPGKASWGEWIEMLSKLATRALRKPERVLTVLSELEPMAKIENVALSEVRHVLETKLSQLRARAVGRPYGKVLVATMEEARGLEFDVVFVPGLAEKIFPQKVVEDPLLLDAARQKIASSLTTNKERTDDERLALRLAVGAASRRVVLSYPRVDVEQARPRTPSFYGLEVLRVAEGQLGDFEHLAQKAAATAEARIGWPAPARREDAVDEAEYDLALLKDVLEKPEDKVDGEGRYLVQANEHLSRALRFRWMRWDPKELRPSDGFVRPNEEALAAIREHATDKRSFSPTALQNFAACPYRFLLSAVHKLAPREEPEEIEDIDPLTRGSLVHEVQYSLLTLLKQDNLLPVTAATLEPARERLDKVLIEVAGEYHDRLSPAIERVWKDAITGIGADLREWLRRMSEDAEWSPAHFELSFGLKDPRAQDVKSTDEPVVLDIGLRLRGSIDLVEETKTGTLRATDHKTGKVRAKKDDTIIGGGEILQPVLYALALEKMFPGRKIESGVLYYCTSAGSFEKVAVMLDDESRHAARAVAKTVGDALEKGFLPTAPHIEKKGFSACTWCDYKRVCGPYEEIRTKKKPQGPLKVLADLRKRR